MKITTRGITAVRPTYSALSALTSHITGNPTRSEAGNHTLGILQGQPLKTQIGILGVQNIHFKSVPSICFWWHQWWLTVEYMLLCSANKKNYFHDVSFANHVGPGHTLTAWMVGQMSHHCPDLSHHWNVSHHRYCVVVLVCIYKKTGFLSFLNITVLQLVPETENGFHLIQGHRTGTNMFYEWSLKKRCIRWETLHYDEIWKHRRMKNE